MNLSSLPVILALFQAPAQPPVPKYRFEVASILGRPMTNATELNGIYDIKLNWTPDDPARKPGTEPADGAGPSLFTALQEQLGWKIESKKGPATVFVVEKAQKPSSN